MLRAVVRLVLLLGLLQLGTAIKVHPQPLEACPQPLEVLPQAEGIPLPWDQYEQGRISILDLLGRPQIRVSCPQGYVPTASGRCRLEKPGICCPQGYPPAASGKGVIDPQHAVSFLHNYTEQNRMAPPMEIQWGGLLDTLGNILDMTAAPFEGAIFGYDLSLQKWRFKSTVEIYRRLEEGWLVPETLPDGRRSLFGVAYVPDSPGSQWDKAAKMVTNLERPRAKIIVAFDWGTGALDIVGLAVDGSLVFTDPNPENIADVTASAAGVLALVVSGPGALILGAFDAGYSMGKLGSWCVKTITGRDSANLIISNLPESYFDTPLYPDGTSNWITSEGRPGKSDIPITGYERDGVVWYSEYWIQRKQSEIKPLTE